MQLHIKVGKKIWLKNTLILMSILAAGSKKSSVVMLIRKSVINSCMGVGKWVVRENGSYIRAYMPIDNNRF